MVLEYNRFLMTSLVIHPKDLEVHLPGSTPGHTTIFELALLIGPILCGWVSIYLNPLFVRLFIPSFLYIFACNDADLRPNCRKLLPAVEVTCKHR